MNNKICINELAVLLSEKENISVENSKEIIVALRDEMAIALKSKKPIQLRGFGSFSYNTFPSRNVRNPKTGETLLSKTRTKIKFKQSSLSIQIK